MVIMIACITIKSGLVPLIEGLCARIVYLRIEIIGGLRRHRFKSSERSVEVWKGWIRYRKEFPNTSGRSASSRIVNSQAQGTESYSKQEGRKQKGVRTKSASKGQHVEVVVVSTQADTSEKFWCRRYLAQRLASIRHVSLSVLSIPKWGHVSLFLTCFMTSSSLSDEFTPTKDVLYSPHDRRGHFF